LLLLSIVPQFLTVSRACALSPKRERERRKTIGFLGASHHHNERSNRARSYFIYKHTTGEKKQVLTRARGERKESEQR